MPCRNSGRRPSTCRRRRARSGARFTNDRVWSALMQRVSLTINGLPVSREVEDETLLAVFLREHLGLTGTHVGCDTTQCGCCVVHLDGTSVKSCTVLAAQADGGRVLTIEGLARDDGSLHPVQEAFRHCHALQCGFCTPGMIMAAVDLIETYPGQLSEAVVREEM